MGLHRNARLGLAGRRVLVGDIEAGFSCREAARRRGVSPTTACKWWRRWSEASGGQRQALACLEDRSSRPQLYEWPCPGDLLHIDSKRFVRFTRPGHAVTGDRHRTSAEKEMRVGYEWVHSLVDDHSRLAYSELHRDEKAATVTAFVERGLAFYTVHGIEASRLLSDNAFVYRHNRSLRELLAKHAIGHLFIRPRRPQTNGKVERFQQTLKREWGLGQTYRSSDHRTQALSHWLSYYNTRRPHSSLGGRPPISRIHNVPRQDT